MKLLVKAGSLTDLKPLSVNADASPLHIDTEHISCDLTVRVKNYWDPQGSQHPDTDSAYFQANPDQTLSIQFTGSFKADQPADDLVWGVRSLSLLSCSLSIIR